jgi:hypothetical protein
LDPTSAIEALKLLRNLLIMDLTTFRLPFKERQSCNRNVMSPVPTTIVFRLRRFEERFTQGALRFMLKLDYYICLHSAGISEGRRLFLNPP